MSDFSVEMEKRLDLDGLVGRGENPTPWSDGNPILETVIAVIYEIEIGGVHANKAFLARLADAVGRCQLPNGSFDKNPERPDQITHDDLKPAAGLTRILNVPETRPLAARLCALGESNGWNLSNTGLPYWNAFARPWDVAYYRLCNTKTPSWYELALLCLSYGLSSVLLLAGKTNPSGDRIRWVCLNAVWGANPWLDAMFYIWCWSATRAYVNVGTMMGWYYGDLNHQYVRWGKLPFRPRRT